MKEKIIKILKNNLVLRGTLILTLAYGLTSYFIGDGIELFEIVIYFIIAFYFIWGYSHEMKNKK